MMADNSTLGTLGSRIFFLVSHQHQHVHSFNVYLPSDYCFGLHVSLPPYPPSQPTIFIRWKHMPKVMILGGETLGGGWVMRVGPQGAPSPLLAWGATTEVCAPEEVPHPILLAP